MSTLKTESERHRRRLERLQQVAALRLAGVRDQRQLARQFGVTQQTISRDFAALDVLYRERAAQDTATAKGQDAERLDQLLIAVWPMATKGSLGAVDRVLRLLERRAALLGLDAPRRVDIETRVRQLAAAAGLDPDAAVAEAGRLLAEVQHRGGSGAGTTR